MSRLTTPSALVALLLAAGLAAPALAASERKAWVVKDTVARAKPSGFGLSLGELGEGTELTVLEVRDAWTKVTDGNEAGWVRSRALRIEGSEPAPEPVQEPEPLVEPPAPTPKAEAPRLERPKPAPRAPSPPPLPPAPPSRRPLVDLGSRPVVVSAAPDLEGSRAVPIGRWQSAPRVLGLREAPSFGVGMTGAIDRSDSVRVLERRGGWGLVESRDGRRGWIVLAALDGPLERRERRVEIAHLD